MKQAHLTFAFAGAAVLGLLFAYAMTPGPVELALFDDEGELFFANFQDSERVQELEVTGFDSAASERKSFVVSKNQEGRWTIPSHSDYPADAAKRMGKSVAFAIGLRKEAIRSDRAQDHEAFGVIDPNLGLDQGVLGRGTRITLRDDKRQVLADLIIGKPVEPGSSKRYVRTPESARTYIATIAEMPDTKFSSWIEKDVLQLSSYDIEKLEIDNYRVVESLRGARLEKGEQLLLKRENFEWKLDGLTDSEELQETAISDATRELDDLTIVGVRRKPEGLTARLTKADGVEIQTLYESLLSKGYYLTQEGAIASNEGDLHVTTREGVRYTLRFGEVLFGDESMVSAESESAKTEGGEEAPKGAANRYLMVTVAADPSAIKAPTGERIAQEELDRRIEARRKIEQITAAVETYKGRNDGQLPPDLAALKAGEKPLLDPEVELDPWGTAYRLEPLEGGLYRVLSYGADKAPAGELAGSDIASDAFTREEDFARVAADWKAHEEKLKAAEKRAEELERRFGPWYYVIAAEGYEKIKLARSELVKPKAATDTPEGEDGE